MENGMDILNKMREIQSRSIALKKVSKEICDETIAKLKELRQYNEENISNKSLLLKEKEIILSLEFNNNSLDSSILIWETILKNKKKCLQELEEKLKTEQNHIFSARSKYCDSVYDFMKQPQKAFTIDSTDHDNSTDLENLNKQFHALEEEFQALNLSIIEKESSLKELNILEETHKEEMLKYEKILDNKKKILKDLTQKVKSLKLGRQQYEIEKLYFLNSNKNYSTDYKDQTETEIVSSYFLDPEKSDLESSNMLNKMHNFYAQKCTTLNDDRISNTMHNSNKHFTEHEFKRCKISDKKECSSAEILKNSLFASSSNSLRMEQILSEKKNKFVPKRPLLSKRMQ